MIYPDSDPDRHLAIEFSRAFSSTSSAPVLLRSSVGYWPGIRRSVQIPVGTEQRHIRDIVFAELAMPRASGEELGSLLAEVPRLASDWDTDTVSVHGLPSDARQYLTGRDGWVPRSLMGFYAEPSKWLPCREVRHALRRAADYGLSYIRATDRQQFEWIRQTLEFLALGPRDSAEQIDRQVQFFETAHERGRGVGLLVIRNERVLAGTFAVLIQGTLYGIMHGYDPSALYFKPNDLLYSGVIATALHIGAAVISWGDVEQDDHGLIHMKRKYSTKTVENPSMHWLGGLGLL